MSITERKPGACEREPLKVGYFSQADAMKLATRWMKRHGGKAWIEMCVGCGLWHVFHVEDEAAK